MKPSASSRSATCCKLTQPSSEYENTAEHSNDTSNPYVCTSTRLCEMLQHMNMVLLTCALTRIIEVQSAVQQDSCTETNCVCVCVSCPL